MKRVNNLGVRRAARAATFFPLRYHSSDILFITVITLIDTCILPLLFPLSSHPCTFVYNFTLPYLRQAGRSLSFDLLLIYLALHSLTRTFHLNISITKE